MLREVAAPAESHRQVAHDGYRRVPRGAQKSRVGALHGHTQCQDQCAIFLAGVGAGVRLPGGLLEQRPQHRSQGNAAGQRAADPGDGGVVGEDSPPPFLGQDQRPSPVPELREEFRAPPIGHRKRVLVGLNGFQRFEHCAVLRHPALYQPVAQRCQATGQPRWQVNTAHADGHGLQRLPVLHQHELGIHVGTERIVRNRHARGDRHPAAGQPHPRRIPLRYRVAKHAIKFAFGQDGALTLPVAQPSRVVVPQQSPYVVDVVDAQRHRIQHARKGFQCQGGDPERTADDRDNDQEGKQPEHRVTASRWTATGHAL